METVGWDALKYHAVSEPQFRWGQAVLADLALRGDETVLDAGCGSGRLTELLMERLPKGRGVALDASADMLEQSKATLAKYGDRVTYVLADLGDFALPAPVDVVFSTATFHWVVDHDALFRCLAAVLPQGGKLHAQCGGQGNLQGFHQIAEDVGARAPYRPHLHGFGAPTYFAGIDETVRRLEANDFTPEVVRLVPAPTPFVDATAFRLFIATVVLRHHLSKLPEALRDPFLDDVVKACEVTALDYVRLDVRAVKR